MSCPSTPLQRTPAKDRVSEDLPIESCDALDARNVFSESLQVKFKSPQVSFHAEGNQHEGSHKNHRSTPESGRGKLKKIKEDIAAKLASRTFQTASPSHIVSKSMLSFDLGPTSRLNNEEEIAGENELFVKFVMGRRNSSGRGTLQRLINKRIALQVGTQAVAQRKMEGKIAQAEVAKENEPTVPPNKERTRKEKKKVPRQIKLPVPRQELSRQSEFYELEIPLGQQDASKRNSVEATAMSLTQVLDQEPMSQTQVLEPMSQTQVFEKTQPRMEPHTPAPMTQYSPGEKLPFLATPFEGHLEPVKEESESELVVQAKEDRKRMIRRFMDIEADESDSEGGVGRGSEEDSESSGDLSDLIASEEEEDDNVDVHAKLHRKWMEEQEDSFDPFLRNKRQVMDEQERESVKERRKKHLATFREMMQKPVGKRNQRPKKKLAETVPEAKPKPIARKPKQAWVKRNPHRKSSVSSCTDIDINIGSTALRSRANGHFCFITAPSKQALEKIALRDEAKTVAEAKAAAGSRLMGAKRFVFGNS